MSKKLRTYVRDHHLSLVCLFLIVSGGTAYATHPGGANTISSADIINSEVTNADLANDSVNVNKITTGAVRADEIASNSVESAEVVNETLVSDDLALHSVTGVEIAPETIDSDDLKTDSVGGDEIDDEDIAAADIGPDAVTASELGPDAVTASELGDVVHRVDPTPTLVAGGLPENGAYTVGASSVSCNAGEELIGGGGQWTPDDQSANDHELWISEVRVIDAGNSVIVDGGNDSGVDHSIAAVAICLSG